MNISSYTRFQWVLLPLAVMLSVLLGSFMFAVQHAEARSGGPDVTAHLSASPRTIDQGEKSKLTWTATKGGRKYKGLDVSINRGIGSVNKKGSRRVSPANTTEYTLTARFLKCEGRVSLLGSCKNKGFLPGFFRKDWTKKSKKRTVTVRVTDPPARCSDGNDNDNDGLTDMDDPGCSDSDDNSEGPAHGPSISASASTVPSGDDVTISWDPNGITGCTLSNNLSGDASSAGNEDITINRTRTFRINCPNGSNSVTVDMGTSLPQTVSSAQCADGSDNDVDGLRDMDDPGCTSASDDTEGPANSASIWFDGPEIVRYGTNVTVNWDNDGITGCSLSGNLSGDASAAGSDVVEVTNTSVFTITCSNGAESTTVQSLPMMFES